MATAADVALTGTIAAGDNPWTVRLDGFAAKTDPWAETTMALASGGLGVRGAIDERPHGAATFLAGAYETSPIHYHERHKGFADATDTRIPVADAASIVVRVDGVRIADADSEPVACERRLDLRTGRLWRRTIWPSPAGRIEIVSERRLPLGDGAVALFDFTITPLDGPAEIELDSGLAAPGSGADQGRDPRIGTANLPPLETVVVDTERGLFVQRTRRSGITIAAACAHTPDPDERLQNENGLSWRWSAAATPDRPLRLTKTVAYAVSNGDADEEGAIGTAREACRRAGRLLAGTDAALEDFWREACVAIDGDPAAEQALRYNMFEVFGSAPRDGTIGLAAKGLTGEGYEGHTFWDGEVFVLPMLAVTAPALARAMLDYRYATLDAARANARALDHARGALFAWRTIAGREASAHYPSGSAQYHINADIAFAIGLYDAATGDDAFMAEKGGEMLAETARIWLQVGHFDADGAFHIFGVTGPDEYTVLIDDNWYTNRMAQRHLRLAADVADRLARTAPETWAATCRRIGLGGDEIAEWRRAADAMHLPFDEARGLDAQDVSFLGKPEWDIAGTPKDRFPLLLHYNPMTLYRHQVSKQADLVLALVLAGDDVTLDRKRRAFDHYASVTVHDSTLSDCSFAILAVEVGQEDAAMEHFRAAAFVDLHDLHGNSHHGAHMAAMGGSWQALVWGFGGFRPADTRPSFAPHLPRQWRGYSFTMLWRHTRMRVEVSDAAVVYRHLAGPPLNLLHHSDAFTLDSGERRFGWAK